MKTPYSEQTKLKEDDVLVIDEFNAFKSMEDQRNVDTELRFKSGFWNCFRPTKELVDFLEEKKIKYHLENINSFY